MKSIKFVLLIIILFSFSYIIKGQTIKGIYETTNSRGYYYCSYFLNKGTFKMYDGGCVHSGYGYGKYKIENLKLILSYKKYFSQDGSELSRKDTVDLEYNESLKIYNPDGLIASTDNSFNFNSGYLKAKYDAIKRYLGKLKKRKRLTKNC